MPAPRQAGVRNYHWVMERTVEVRELIDTLRSARVAAVEMASRGDIGNVFGRPSDDPSGFTYLVKLLDVHPSLGKVMGRRLMAQLGLDQFVRVSSLSDEDKKKILAACGGAG